MTGLQEALVVVLALWLGVLTLVVVLLVRQLSLLTVRLSFAAPYVAADADGLDIGSPVPSSLNEQVALDGEPRTLLFLSATCAPCREIASALSSKGVGDGVLAVIAGDPESAGAVSTLLPSSVETVVDPEATQVARALQVTSVPFGLRVEHGIVSAKAYLHAPEDLDRLDFAKASTTGAETLVGS